VYSPLVERLGWTLIHFLWQGAAIAVLLAIVLFVSKSKSGIRRYTLASAALLLIGIAPVITFLALAPKVSPVAAPLAVSIGKPIVSAPVAAHFSAPVAKPLTFRDALPYLVVLWALGVIGLSLRMVGGLLQIERLKRWHSKPAAAEWQAKLDELAKSIGLKRHIRLLVSDRIEVPAALGLLRAIVVIPCRMLTSLSPEEVEALLLHELAHIRRHDYFVNLLQTALETLLFYHPAVWWVSKVIRTEREHCCDDLVVGTLHNPFVFARALASLEDQRRLMPELAMSAQGGFLVNRIRRILGIAEPTTKFVPAWPSLIALGSVTLALTATVGAQVLHTKAKPAKKHTHRAKSHASAASLPAHPARIMLPAVPATVVAPKLLPPTKGVRAAALPPAAARSVMPPIEVASGVASQGGVPPPAISIPAYPAVSAPAALAPVPAPATLGRASAGSVAPAAVASPVRGKAHGGTIAPALSAPAALPTTSPAGVMPTTAPRPSRPLPGQAPAGRALPSPASTPPPLYASTQPAQIPVPSATGDANQTSEFVSIDTSNMTFAQAIANVCRQTGWSYVIEPGTFPAVQLNMRNKFHTEVLKAICFAANATYRIEGGAYYIVHKTDVAVDPERDELVFKNTSFHEALQSLAKRYHISITAEPGQYPSVNLSLSHADPMEALDALRIATGTTYKQEGSLFVFTNKK